MQHIDDISLELYVLGDPGTEPKRQAIESHLQTCEACRLIVDNLHAFYDEAEEILESDEPIPLQSIRRQHADSSALYKSESSHVGPIRSARSKDLRRYIKVHPVKAAAGSMLIFAGLAFLAGMFLPVGKTSHTNPYGFHFNATNGSFEILNSSQDILWELKLANPPTFAELNLSHLSQEMLIDDLDGEGSKEVVTISRLAGDPLPLGAPLRIFDSSRKLQSSFSPIDTVSYLHRQYSSSWSPYLVSAVGTRRGIQKELIVAWHNGRSPSLVTRLNAKSELLGEYWHFGNPLTANEITLAGETHPCIALGGRNDSDDSTHHEFLFISILDPGKIVGSAKSVCSPGFNLPTSEAELYYIRIPYSSLDSVLQNGTTISSITESSSGLLRVHTSNGASLDSDESVGFEFSFEPDMTVLQVKSSDWTDRSFAAQVSKGRLKGKLDEAYLTRVKESVRYWDGKRWSTTPVRLDRRHTAE